MSETTEATIPTTHRLKTWPEYFAAVLDGTKTFELRETSDRNFRVGDTLELLEFDPAVQELTGREITKTVSYVLPGPAFGLKADHAILGFANELKAELANHEAIFNEVEEVYCTITNGRFSKVDTDAMYIIGDVQRQIDAAHAEGRKVVEDELSKLARGLFNPPVGAQSGMREIQNAGDDERERIRKGGQVR